MIIIGTSSNSKSEDIIRAVNEIYPNQVIINLPKVRKIYEVLEAPEDEDTVLGNSKSKCKFYSNELKNHEEFLGSHLITEDTGLFINHLNGEPGVRTARYSGTHDYDTTNKIILDKMINAEDRSAYVESSICINKIGEDAIYSSTYKLYGYISLKESDIPGFAFDTIFEPEGYLATMSELTYVDINFRNILPRYKCLKSLITSLRNDI